MVLQAGILSKDWTIFPNEARTFTTLNDTAAWWMFTNFSKLLLAGWTVKFTCDGTTGPTSGADTTNRLATQANCTTQGAAAGNAQSFFVVQNVDTVQVMITYQGASADILRISYSPGGLFVPAGTANQQPTATDEVVVSAANTIINATASANRVMTIWTSDDTTQWSMALFRSSAIVNIIGVEKTNDLTASGVFVKPYVGYRYTTANRSTAVGAPVGGVTGTAVGASGHIGTVARIITFSTSRITRIGGGELLLAPLAGNVTVVEGLMANTPPAAQFSVGSPLFPLYWSGEKAANLDGIICYPIDWWQVLTASLTVPALGNFSPGFDFGDTPGVDPLRTNWFVALGTAMLRPWKNSAVAMDIAA